MTYLTLTNNFSLLFILLFLFNNLIIITLSRRYLTYRGVQIISIIINILFLLSCLYYWKFYILDSAQTIFCYKINSNNWSNINYEISFKINSLSFLFILLVSIIGTATNFYILNYFKFEERSEEFILLINWFIFSMIFLVISNNLFTIIIGWELIGLTSFLLINFWRFKVSTLACSFKAFVFNKFSDIFLMIGFCILWNTYKTSNVDTLLTLINLTPSNNASLYKAGICILISACVKSAQFIGHLWLPDSMEAPVPASSLIHSATLVSAGIYLLLKFQPLFIHTGLTNIIFFIGSFTACFGGLVAASQSDMKKLLAYSTISHCGFIFASITLNNFIVTIVYLYLHGLFKAVTFFCAGSIIKYNNTQDTRQMGMNKNQIVHIVMLSVAAINLGGLPFTFGYLYKFLFLSYLIITPVNLVSYGFCLIGMLTSIAYVFKIIYYSCFDFRKGTYQHLLGLLSISNNSIKELFKNYNFLKLIAFYIIYLFSAIFYCIVKYYILKNYIFFYYTNDFQSSDYKFLNDLMVSNAHLISLYYILFFTAVCSLILISWRGIIFQENIGAIIGIIIGIGSFYNFNRPFDCIIFRSGFLDIFLHIL